MAFVNQSFDYSFGRRPRLPVCLTRLSNARSRMRQLFPIRRSLFSMALNFERELHIIFNPGHTECCGFPPLPGGPCALFAFFSPSVSLGLSPQPGVSCALRAPPPIGNSANSIFVEVRLVHSVRPPPPMQAFFLRRDGSPAIRFLAFHSNLFVLISL